MENTKNKTNNLEDFEPHLKAALSYLLPPITGIVFYLKEDKDKFVMFHSMQSILFGITFYILWRFLNIRLFFLFRNVTQPVLSLVIAGYWLYLLYSAYNKKEVKIPFLGDIAEKVVNKKS